MKRFAQWFVSGLGLASGVGLVVWLSSASFFNDNTPKDLPLSTVEVVSLERVSLSDNLTIAVFVKNNNTTEVMVEPKLTVTSAGKIIYTCTPYYATYKVAPGNERVQFQCYEVKAANVPPDAKLEVTIEKITAVKSN